MDVLVSGHGYDPDNTLEAARRTSPFRKLILLSTRPESSDLKELARLEKLAKAEVLVRPVHPFELLPTLTTAKRVLEDHAKDELRVHVAGGPNVVASALLLAAFDHGREAFLCHPHGVSRFPVAVAKGFQERFNESDRRALVALKPGQSVTYVRLIEQTGLSASTVRDALLRLKKGNLVTTDASAAALTLTGTYYRAHLAE